MERGKAASDIDQPGVRIVTPRLLLRQHRLDDLAPRMAMAADPDVMGFIGGPQGHEDGWSRIVRFAGHWALFGWGLFLVEDRISGAFLGECGLSHFGRDLGPGFDDAPEAAWCFARVAHGRGLALEAMQAALGWYAEHIDIARTVCLIAPENAPSLKLADRLGYHLYGGTTYRDRPSLMLERLDPASVSARPGPNVPNRAPTR